MSTLTTLTPHTHLHQTSLPVMEHFYTIQGEGYNTGRPAYFIRLGGCDVACHWCDVKDSWDAARHPQYSVNEIVNWVLSAKAPHAVITGGEPLMHPLHELTSALHQQGIKTWIETSGAHPLSGDWDWICFSPKKFKKPVNDIYQYANELKIIVYHKSDLDWALEHAAKVKEGCRLYLQPEWSKSEEMLPLMIDFVKQHTRWTLSLQTHKYMDIP